MAVFYSAFVPCLAQRSLEQGVEFWDTITNVIVYVIFFFISLCLDVGVLFACLFCSCFVPACNVYSKRILIVTRRQISKV